MSDKEKQFCLEFIEMLSDEDMMYLYHITGKGIGDLILENGLFLSENRLSSTTIPIDKEILSDPIKFIKEENASNLRETDELIIIGCPKDEVNNLISKNYNDYSKWNQDQSCDYIIDSNYIMGYVDMDSLDFTYNHNYSYNINKNL